MDAPSLHDVWETCRRKAVTGGKHQSHQSLVNAVVALERR